MLVIHSAPAYRYGLVHGLKELGIDASEGETVKAAEQAEWDVCLLHIPADDTSPLAQVRQAGEGLVIALVDSLTVDNCRDAIRAGANGVAPHDADFDDIVEALRLAQWGEMRVPLALLRTLVDTSPVAPNGLTLSQSETDLVRQLASGRPVADIAADLGYSERQMYRLAREIYFKLGASNRSEAIATAARWRLLDDAS
ncbi:LuxR C-terminal-related transcriptional regulator [Streptomyces sp. NPDC058773]|uniref:LuxR C-terminal-related transcriptional regulator n=1 Tax=Streptomyces sp. NPDC058773 TaxID=3346632 RepID=UPI0036A38243